MIRRDDRGDWLVIAQVEHARLAAELARVWGNERVASLAAFPTLVWGIEHHDDGWREWDDAPRINPATGFPRSFLEMRMRDSTAIWTRSIAVCSSEPLAGVAVSRHFCYLAEQVLSGGRADADDRQSIDRFLQEQAAGQGALTMKLFLREQSDVQSGLANEASSKHAAAGTNGDVDKSCDLGFRTVRFFDLVSLWLCCAERHGSEQLVAPMGEAVKLIPRNSAHIVIEPYPLCVDSLRLETEARRLAARPYPNDADLQAALRTAPVEVLVWTIVPT